MKTETEREIAVLQELLNGGARPMRDLESRRLETVTANITVLDAYISFILNVIFGGKPNKLELRIARALFSPTANVVLIPRGRPTLACAVSVDEFFARENEVLGYENNWRESMRSHDPFVDGSKQNRIKVNVVLDAELLGSARRHIDLIFTMRGASPSQRIASCTIVFDEAYCSRSPATLY